MKRLIMVLFSITPNVPASPETFDCLNEHPFNMISLAPFEVDPMHEDFDLPIDQVNLKKNSRC